MPNYNESNGDLSNNRLSPTEIAVSLSGSNLVTGSTTNSPLDRDFFTFTVAENSKVRNILLKDYTGSNKNSYFAVVEGTQFPDLEDDSSFLVSKLIDDVESGSDLLDPTVGNKDLEAFGGSGNKGGPGELGPGTYSVWYQETGSNTTYEFDIQMEGTIAPPPPVTASKLLTPGEERIQVDLGTDGANALQFSIDSLNLEGVSEVQLFKTDNTGNVIGDGPTAAFSLLKPLPELTGFSPQFTVDGLSDGEYWEVVLAKSDGTTTATPTQINDREVGLDFGDNNLLTLSLDKFDTGIKTGALTVDGDGDEFIDLSSEGGQVTATFSVFSEAAYNNTVGFYVAANDGGVVDPVTGLTIMPGEAGYKEAAIAQRIDTTLSGENGLEKTVGSVSLDAGGFLGMFLAVDSADLTAGEVFFSFAGANSDGQDHVKALGNNAFGFEDLVGLGDADFNDAIVSFSFA